MALNLVCAVLDRGPANLADMAVLLAIADSADKDTGEAWPSQATLARRSRQTDRNVRNVIARLLADGWLLRVEPRTRPNGSRASSVYVVNLDKLGEGSNRPASVEKRKPVPARNHVPGRRAEPRSAPPEPRSGHVPEPRSALEPSHNGTLSSDAGFEGLSAYQKALLRRGDDVMIGAFLWKRNAPAYGELKARFDAWDRAA